MTVVGKMPSDETVSGEYQSISVAPTIPRGGEVTHTSYETAALHVAAYGVPARDREIAMHIFGRLRRTRYIAHALLLAGLLWLIVSANPTTAADVQVVIQNFAFSPATITVPIGTIVVWTNKDSDPHSAASDTAGIFNTGILEQGQSVKATFGTPGTFTNQCDLHDGMLATIIVTDASSDGDTTTLWRLVATAT